MIATADLRRLVTPRPAATSGGWCWSVTPASCKPSVGVACSPSCAATAGSTSSNTSTGSPTAWEAEASLLLRAGDPRALDAYEAHGRIIPGTLDEHLDEIATAWIDRHQNGDTVAVVASTNEHVDLLNDAVQNRPARRR